MTTALNGFEVSVTAADGLPKVRVSFASGELIFETDRVSVTGLQKMPEVFEAAASMAYSELEHYYDRLRATRETTKQCG